MSEASSLLRRFTKPAVDLMVLNAETLGSLWLRRTAVMSELVQSSVERTRAVANAKDLAEAAHLQNEFGREVVQKLTGLQRDSFSTLRESYTKAGEVIRGAVTPAKAG